MAKENMDTKNTGEKPEENKPTRKNRKNRVFFVITIIVTAASFMEFRWISLQARHLQREMISEGRIELLTINL